MEIKSASISISGQKFRLIPDGNNDAAVDCDGSGSVSFEKTAEIRILGIEPNISTGPDSSGGA